MKLIEFQNQMQIDRASNGTFAGARLADVTVQGLQRFQRENDIQNPIPPEKFHVTILYSRKPCPEYEPAGKYPAPIAADFLAWDLFPSQKDKDGNHSNCLVMKINSPELRARHRYLMDKHGATFDFDEYIPHLTLSYNAGDVLLEALPEFVEPIIITREYYQPIDLSWATNN